MLAGKIGRERRIQKYLSLCRKKGGKNRDTISANQMLLVQDPEIVQHWRQCLYFIGKHTCPFQVNKDEAI